ncbi:MAG: tetratricopeptide repeat-containing glycosyltransferase family protein [Bdellovibrionales bacterium]
MTSPLTSQPIPYDANDLFARGVAAQASGNLVTAIQEWQHVLDLDPQHAPTLYNLAVASVLTGDEAGAAEYYEKLLAFQPTHRDALFNLGNLRKRQHLDLEAKNLFQRLISAHPNFSSGWVNLAKTYSDQGDPKTAKQLLLKALSIDPSHIIAHWNLSHLLLRSHLWEEAWREYEWRLQIPSWFKPPVKAPSWKKNDPARRILLWNDQGIGDAIQFLRYPRFLAELGHEVWVLVQEGIKSIAATAPGVTGVVGPNDIFPEFDAQAPLLSMPHRLDMPNPLAVGNAPYLSSAKSLPLPHRSGQLAVGLVWAGNQKLKRDNYRSAPLSSLKALFNIEGIDWYSLQFGKARDQIHEHNLSDKIVDMSPMLHDFSDTAALELDLIISVDTATAHLAGAIGRPCWIMLPTNLDWRFADNEMVRLWYTSMRPFRQTRAGDWEGVAALIATALKDELAKKNRRTDFSSARR